MRVVLTCAPAHGHLHPLLPLARAFAAAGDDVVMATSPEMCARAEAVGLSTAAVGPNIEVWVQELAGRTAGVPGDGLPADRILPYFVPRLFAEIGAKHMIDDLVRVVAGADLVVFESFAFAGPLAAAIGGVQAAHHLLGPAPPLEAMTLAGDAVSPLWRKWKMDWHPYGGVYDGVTLNICPPALGTRDIPEGVEVVPLSPVIADATQGEGLPSWVQALPDRPTIYMTLGTTANSDQSVFTAALDGLGDEPVNVIITVGPNGDPATLGTLPANARAERYIPQSLLLPLCRAVINHGGSGTMLATLRCGLPQLIIPQSADQYVNAAICAEAGVAHRLLPDEVSPAAIRERVRQLVQDSALQHRCAHVRAEIEAMPEPAAVVRRLKAT